MLRIVRLASVAAIACTLGACAMLSGLDQLQKDDCALDACVDAAAAADATSDVRASQRDAGADTTSISDASDHDASLDAAADATVDVDPRDAASDAGIDASQAGADCGSPTDPDHCGSCTTRCGSCAGARVCNNGACVGGTVYFYEPFTDNSQGWTLDTTWSIARTCASPPAPQKGFPDPTMDHTPLVTGSGVVGAFACGNNPAGQTSAVRYATSPAVNVASAPALKLTFYRWLNSDSATWMVSTVDVFDGGAWVNVYTNPTGNGNIVADSSWGKLEYDVTAHKSSTFRVRFGYAVVATGVYSVSGWNVDDVTLSTASCP